jgi:hypothetical protein
MKATLLAFLLTLTNFFDIPVFWPIRASASLCTLRALAHALTDSFLRHAHVRPCPVVIYFITLFSLTMRERIAHMIKYKYLPCSWGKKKYAAKAGPGAAQGKGGAMFQGKSSN